jgi:hypothetical protein
MIALRRKLPPLPDILSLYGTIVFLIYGWAIVTFFWKVPSWLYFLSLGDVAAILCYALASSMLESTIILLIFLTLALILPSRWLVDKFVVRGSTVMIILTFWVAAFTLITLIQLPTGSDILTFGVIAFVTIALGILIVERIPPLQNLLSALGKRLTIFLYLWLPLSIAGILVIFVRIV